MPFDGQSRREPMFNLPWPVTALTAAMVLAFLATTFLAPNLMGRMGVSARAIEAGEWSKLISYQFAHGGFSHLAMNVAGLMAFGAPIARLLGLNPAGVALFLAYFFICGIVAALGHLAVERPAGALLIGASGAVSGLWGGASRLLGRRSGLAPVFSRPVMSQAAVFVVLNVVIGFVGPLFGLPIAWQAHLFGFALGLVMIGPLSRMRAA